MGKGFAIVAVLIGLGLIPVLPALLGLAKHHANRQVRVAVRVVAALCLFLCFVQSFAGLLGAALRHTR